MPTTLNGLMNHDLAEEAFANTDGGGRPHFTQTSRADTFEVSRDDGGMFREGLDDDDIEEWLKIRGDRVITRMIFIDAIPEKPDKLPVTESVLRRAFQSFEISPRFTDNLSRQRMPGREVHRHKTGLVRHQMWHSAILRADPTLGHVEHANHVADLTRQVSYWQRFCIWSDYRSTHGEEDAGCGPSTYMIWRCPIEIKQAFAHTFKGEAGLKLLHHPLAAHAFIMERTVQHAYNFSATCSAPLYIWEHKATDLRTPNDYTARSRAFLSLARQLHQVSTDFDILSASADHLHTQNEWFGKNLNIRDGARHHDSQDAENAQSTMNDIFDNLRKEIVLLRAYGNLYIERSKIGVDECFAITNQRDSDLNIRIAQASIQDNHSLRVIQILSMIFLPGSFISSIFGMGFFSTSPTDDGDGVFVASNRWWMYFAVAVPLTILVMGLMQYYQLRDSGKAGKEWSRRHSLTDSDPETQDSGRKRS